MTDQYPRHIKLEAVTNFRDLGGYQARGGRTLAWRRVYRSGEFSRMTRNDFDRLTGEIGLASILDLRSTIERARQGTGLLSAAGIRHHPVPFIADGGDRNSDLRRYKDFSSMGEFYVYLVGKPEFGRRIIEALEVIAAPENHPLVFHCAIGKDRTGILAAVLLSALDVADEDIIEDYTLSAPYMVELISYKDKDPEIATAVKVLPGYFWEAVPESMNLLLSTLKKEYGSTVGYLKENGADSSLVKRLEKALLV
jgi:protein-tyrosine phosphatase